jgi:DNA repair protein RecO (recombination protein O)
MNRYGASTGIVLCKKDILKSDKIIYIFTRDRGKISLLARGISSITSRRLSHLESGNYIKFSYSTKGDYSYLQETDLVYGYSKIKASNEKVHTLFTLLFILYQILPENQAEEILFENTLTVLKNLNNREVFTSKDLDQFLMRLLLQTGYLDKGKTEEALFNPITYIEEIIGKKVHVPIF